MSESTKVYLVLALFKDIEFVGGKVPLPPGEYVLLAYADRDKALEAACGRFEVVVIELEDDRKEGK